MKTKWSKKYLLLIVSIFPLLINAQSLKPNWQNLDLKTDSVFGISTEKAYTELLKGKKHVPVLIAVIYDGTDIYYENRKNILLANYKKIAVNHIDDNGYMGGWGDVLQYFHVQTAYQLKVYYGNDNHNDVIGADADPGANVACIVGATSAYNIGIRGADSDVMIMMVRAAPDGDERDKDVASAIKYAIDKGARVINMSFGRTGLWNKKDKKAVDDAVKYAVNKDVLIVHCAGNDDTDCDKKMFYPKMFYVDSSGIASTWIEVGASGPFDDEKLKVDSSNYGKAHVDVFGPNSTCALDTGTSMAIPVAAGLAALIRSYYPKLTAIQVKEIILNSVVKVNHDVVIHGKKVPFADICKTSGIVNAYNALKLAATY